jgi:hypothetical protein
MKTTKFLNPSGLLSVTPAPAGISGKNLPEFEITRMPGYAFFGERQIPGSASILRMLPGLPFALWPDGKVAALLSDCRWEDRI